MLLQGNIRQVEEDVSDVGKAIRIVFEGNCSNKCSVLSRGDDQSVKEGVRVDGSRGKS